MYSCKNPPERKFHRTFDKNGVSMCLQWTVEDVGDWIELALKLPQYKECFTSNYINGKRLIKMEASNLPKIGITHFDHIKFITSRIRELLEIDYPNSGRSICLPPKDTMEHFYERKSHSGKESSRLTFEEHVEYLDKFNQHGVPMNNQLAR